MLDELMFYPILKSRSYKKYYLLNLLCKDTIFFITTIITGKNIILSCTGYVFNTGEHSI